MGIVSFIRHLIFPHHSNNHRAKLLHYDTMFLVSFLLLLGAFFLPGIKQSHPSVLGAHIDITITDLVTMTNQQRVNAGLAPLTLNSELTLAAQNKAQDMFAKNYWAHFAPDGSTSPWMFIRNAGYDYTYAGENLARGFTDVPSVMQAWMASPDHRANILNRNYTDVGFAVAQGDLTGEKGTTLIVEEFGARAAQISQNTTNNSTPNTTPTTVAQAPQIPGIQPVLAQGNNGIQQSPTVDSYAFAKNVVVILLGVFILVFLLDMILIERKKIARLVSHNIDHILFLTGVLILILTLLKGKIF